MSTWTHVTGVVRVDAIRMGMETEVNWDDIFGKECLWEESPSVWHDLDEHPEKYMPCGSEGTLQKTVWENPEKSCMAAYTVSIFGDLRDWYDVDAIIDWFKRIVKDENLLWVRSAVITVTNGQVTKTWSSNFGKETEV